MWKKDEVPEQTPAPRMDERGRSERRPAEVPASQRATIGRSITIRGDVTGEEDLLIQGRVEGSVDLRQHAITVGSEGEVKASVKGRVVTVEGMVEGDLRAEEQVILRSSAHVQGDITAPRVVLEDGARFRGGVDMGEVKAAGGQSDAGNLSASRSGSNVGKPAITPGKAVTEPVESASGPIKDPGKERSPAEVAARERS